MRTLVVMLTVFVCLLGVYALDEASTLPNGEADVSQNPQVDMVIVGFRHAHRNPTQFLKNDTTHEEWAWEGLSQLTTIGKRQAYSLGTFLHERYQQLIGSEFFPSQVKAYSSSADRCQMTLQTVMAAMFEPQGRSMWNPQLAWQPIPYEVNDPLLRMYNIQCPHFKQVYQGISDDNVPLAVEWLKREANLAAYVARKSGLNASLSDLADVTDNLAAMKLRGYPLPTWVTSPELDGYPPKDMYTDIMQFDMAHQIMCADDQACARIMAGLWLDQIMQVLRAKSAGQLNERRGQFYAAHTETVLSLIRLLKAEGVQDTPVSAGFILEYVQQPQPAVRFIYHQADPDNPEERLDEVKLLPYCNGEEWCLLDTFLANVAANAFSDWKEACNLPKCPV